MCCLVKVGLDVLSAWTSVCFDQVSFRATGQAAGKPVLELIDFSPEHVQRSCCPFPYLDSSDKLLLLESLVFVNSSLNTFKLSFPAAVRGGWWSYWYFYGNSQGPTRCAVG